MKTYILITLAVFSAAILSCQKDNNKSAIKYDSVTKGGCFSKIAISPVSLNDTVIFSIENDTLNMFVGLHYNCCGKLVESVKTDGNLIVVNITDTTTVACRCFCQFTWNFKLTNYTLSKIQYQVNLKSFNKDTFIPVMEGEIKP